MLRLLLTFFFSIVCFYFVLGQNIQLESEDFNGNTHVFNLNSGLVGDNTGPNQWVVNNEFIGTPLYPNTLSQDNVVSGTINGAPHSKYLHIHDVNASNDEEIANANFDPDTASDRFAHMGEPICTKSLYNVTLTFYCLVEGYDSAYGQVYASKDFGPWFQIGPDKLMDEPEWRRIDITDPALDNTEELRIGFRWVNTDNAEPTSTSLSIDEVIVVADYDHVNNPVEITSEPVTDTACRGQSATVQFSLSDTLCAGTYRFEYSEPGGGFQNPRSIGTINWQPNFPTTFNITIPAFNDMDTGVCYRVRVTRTSPQPIITGEISTVCLTIVDCPPDITTNQPPVTIGSGGGGGPGGGGLGDGYVLCAGSAMDIPFFSDGTIYEDNYYVGLISNEVDTLTDSTFALVNPDTIGQMPDPNDYPPGPQPGMVGGIVPDTLEPGCNYYVQVISTSPFSRGTLYGPFCVRKCDITTNDQVSLEVCVTDTSGFEQMIAIELNSWVDSTGDTMEYLPGNEFLIQILDFNSLGVINTGGFGTELTTDLDSLLLEIPDFQTLQTMGIDPGTYYMRVIATNNNGENDTLGTIIRLTIGRISTQPIFAIAEDSTACLNETVTFFVQPFNFQSTYEWQIEDGRTFDAGSSSSFNIFANSPNDVIMRVREDNFGCVGPWSPWDTISILETPQAVMDLPDKTCIGDTIEIDATFYRKTFYRWTVGPSGNLIEGNEILEMGNNEVTIIFDTLGLQAIELYVLNDCSSDETPGAIEVFDYPDTDAGNDTTVCKGEQVSLEASPGGHQQTFWLEGNSIVSTEPDFTTTVNSDKSYILYIENEGGCVARDTIHLTAEDPPPPASDSAFICLQADTASLGTEYEGATYEWSTGSTADSIHVAEEGEYAVTVTDHGEQCPSVKEFTVAKQGPPGTDTVRACEDDGAGLGTEYEEARYAWSTGEDSDSISVADEGTYSLTVTDHGEDCPAYKRYQVTWKPCEPTFDVPNAFTPNGDGLNDQFNVVGSHYDILEMRIYNRWGELMFRSTDLSEGWDGNFRGKKQDPGVYTYVIRYEDDFGEQHVEKGNVTLIR